MKLLIATLLLVAASANAANLLSNSSFEMGQRGWSHVSDNNWSREESDYYQSSVAYDGSWAPGIWFAPQSETNSTVGIVSQVYRLKTNTVYTLSAYLRQNAAGSYNMTIGIRNPRTGSIPWFVQCNPGLNTWTRFSVTFTNGTATADYQVTFYPGSTGYSGIKGFWDAFQLEEGASATAYARKSPDMNVGLHPTILGNTFYETETPEVPLYYYATPASTNTIDYELIRWIDGSVAKSGSFTITNAAATGVTNYVDISLPSSKRGHFRFLAQVRGLDDSRQEVVASIVPEYRTLNSSTNGMFGSHLRGQPIWLKQARRAGLTWSRTLSIQRKVASWYETEPTDDNFLFAHNSYVTNTIFYGINPLIGLGDGDPSSPATDHPTFATNGGGGILIPQLTNWVYNMASNYSALGVKYFEGWNEPDTEAQLTEAEYRAILTNSYDMVKLASPTAIVVAPSEFYTNFVWTAMSSGGTSNYFDIYSTHAYDPYATQGFTGAETVAGWLGRDQVWNTEFGASAFSEYRVLRWENVVAAYDPFTGAAGSDETRNTHSSAFYVVRSFAKQSGTKLKKFIQYEGRTDGAYNSMINWSMFDWDQTLRPIGVATAALAWLADDDTKTTKHASKDLGLGSLVHCEVFTVDTTNSLAIAWTQHTTNLYKLQTSLSSTDFMPFDAAGNTLTYSAGVDFAVMPVYLKATNTTATALAASLTAASTTDTEAPVIVINSGPIGTVTETANRDFRWWAVDNVAFNRWTSQTNSILYRWSLDGAAFSSWTTTNRVEYASIGSTGSFVLEAKDQAGNTSSETWEWPYVELTGTTGTGRPGQFLPGLIP